MRFLGPVPMLVGIAAAAVVSWLAIAWLLRLPPDPQHLVVRRLQAGFRRCPADLGGQERHSAKLKAP